MALLTVNTKWSKVPPIHLQRPRPKFLSVLLYDIPFLSYRPFLDNCTEWIQNVIKHQRSKVYLHKITSPESQSSLHFVLQPVIISYRLLSDKCTRNTKWSKVPYIFIPFSSVSSRCPVTGRFETRAPNDPKITLNTKSSKELKMHMTTTPSSKFQSISFYSLPFSRYRPFWDKCTKWPQNALAQ